MQVSKKVLNINNEIVLNNYSITSLFNTKGLLCRVARNCFSKICTPTPIYDFVHFYVLKPCIFNVLPDNFTQ